MFQHLFRVFIFWIEFQQFLIIPDCKFFFASLLISFAKTIIGIGRIRVLRNDELENLNGLLLFVISQEPDASSGRLAAVVTPLILGFFNSSFLTVSNLSFKLPKIST